MPFAFDWLYRRLDASYFWLFIAFEVLITEATRCLLEGAEPKLLERGEVPLKGKTEPTPIYALAALDGRSNVLGAKLTADA